MANFYAQYPAEGVSTTTVQTVQGEGTAGVQTGGILTVQGDPAGTPVPVSGNITASSLAVGPTGSAVPADADYAGMNVGGTLTGLTGSVNGLFTVVNAALPAGTNIVGKIGIDQTTPGTTNGVQVNAALPAGANIVGKVGIDQTTPGTTNGVQVNAALPAGANIVGKFGIDQTTPGTTNGVQINAALPGGSNTIGNIGTVTTVTAVTAISTALPVGTNILGKVGIDQTTPGTTNGVQINAAIPAGSNIVGKVGIDQTTPGTTNAVQATSGTTAVWEAEGSIAAGSITSVYQTVFTPAANTKILYMRNNTNASVTVSMDGGATINFVLDAGDQVSTDFVANGLKSPTTAIQIKSTGSPTTGSFRVNGCS